MFIGLVYIRPVLTLVLIGLFGNTDVHDWHKSYVSCSKFIEHFKLYNCI